MASLRTLTDVELVQFRGTALDLISEIERLSFELRAKKADRAITATPPRPKTFDDEVALERKFPMFGSELTKMQTRLRVESWKSLARQYDVPYATVKARMLEVSAAASA